MSYKAEAQIVRELGKFLLNDSLFRGTKPVLWSVIEKTALAEAEVEYYDHTSTTLWVRFPINNASIIIWTTTPWTIPGNRAVAVNPNNNYVRIRVTNKTDASLAIIGEEIIIAESLLTTTTTTVGITAYDIVDTLLGEDLVGTTCKHPLYKHGYDFDVPVLAADFVEMDTGTGFVHIAPGHGLDDWELCLKNNIDVPDIVGPDGVFNNIPLFAGVKVIDINKDGKAYFPANKKVIEALVAENSILAQSTIKHSYPHSWISKTPLIIRTTPQWFISMDKTGIRTNALNAIDDVRFIPTQGQNRLRNMINTRPDWCISRQRSWGVPLTIFVNKKTNEPLRDENVLNRIADLIEKEGADIWFKAPAKDFLGDSYNPDEYEQVFDILDVWFDSGATHSFVLNNWELDWPASLYLEGSDQHRGWFQSSLLESCGTRGVAPYKAVLTHGFVMAEDGQKMSKSLGNIVSPQDVVDEYGADILRLWVVNSDYSDDLRIGPEILKQQVDIYRRLRNTLRYLLGSLNGYTATEEISYANLPELERWVLNRLSGLDKQLRSACDNFQYHGFINELHNFCTNDLSAFYFDIRKDSLYCDDIMSHKRRAARTVFNILFDTLTKWVAPFLCFTAEEAWLVKNPNSDSSIHLSQFPILPAEWQDNALNDKWKYIRDLRSVVTSLLEVERTSKRINSSLQAEINIWLEPDYNKFVVGLDLAEIIIASCVTVKQDRPPDNVFTLPGVEWVKALVLPAKGNKCDRCWKILPTVGYTTLCPRCVDVLEKSNIHS
jgi:isoleucyl-tRNA synthetase